MSTSVGPAVTAMPSMRKNDCECGQATLVIGTGMAEMALDDGRVSGAGREAERCSTLRSSTTEQPSNRDDKDEMTRERLSHSR